MHEGKVQHIRGRLREWNLFPAHAEADFECLVNEAVVALEEGFGALDLAAVIQNEFVNHTGEPGPDDDVMRIADELVQWWAQQKNR